MTNTLLLLILLVNNFNNYENITLNSNIKEVTVYQDRAQVLKEAEILLDKGEFRLEFDFLPSNIDENSIQLSTYGDNIIKDLSITTKYYSEIPDKKIRKAIKAFK